MEILVLCIFFSCILLLPSSPSPASAATVFNDASALLQFKKSSVSADPNGFLNNWKSSNSTSPCSWNGVFCPHSGGPVRGLNLSNMGLAGRINLDDLMSLSTLRHLDLHGNHFSSNLSTAASPACAFETVDLSSNNISASLAAGFLSTCNGLVSLNLSHNSIGGVLPIGSPSLLSLDLAHNNFSLELSTVDFSGCGAVTVLDISSNRLTAGLPPSLANCSNLQRLNLSNNQLTGGIPADLAQTCSTLTELDLSANKLTGGVPPAFAGCSSLQSLNLENNEVSGDFVELVIGTMPALRSLHLAFNNLSRPVPLKALSNVSTLEVIDLSSNELTGVIPTNLCSYLRSLQRLLLPNNFISGTVPGELGNCVNLESVDLSFNWLSGTIPFSVWSLPKLTDLIMWANNLSGEIPDTLCSANATLEMLILSHNLITGTIPSSIIKCKNLIWVSLSSNRLTGGIPTGMGDNLPNLAILQIGNNFLSGNIPPDLGRCQSLIWLDLNNNTLTGPIPPSLASQTGLIVPGSVSGKEFAFLRHAAGNVCPGAGELFEFEGIRTERLAEFPLVHSCPATRIYIGMTVYSYTANGSMIYLDLSYNLLNETIPVSFGSMEYLQVMNLGHNDLTGKIPESFGGLKSMLGLDLSHNHLTGSIPGILGTLTFLDDLDVSFNDLSGPIPGSGQLTTFPATRYENNSGLCGPPLLPCGHGGGNGNNSGFRKQSSISTEGSLLIGAAVCVSIVGLLILVLYRLKQHQKKDPTLGYIEELQSYSGTASWKFSGVLEPLSISVSTFEKPLRNLTFAQLLEATNGFNADSLIGSGGFGEVYKARLKDDSIVAIKKLIQITGQGDREFMAEMETIGKIKHRNLVPLLGYCKVGDERLLVYEYMKHGSLDMVLHDKSNRGGCSKLDWAARKKIAIGAARGLAFLHHSCIPHIIHRDMKSSNVLLDDNLEARVSDFGMARLMNALDTHLSVSTLAGTPGYVPPEYYQSFRCTTKGDVYSYGVVLLELVSGKKPIDTIEFGDNNLVGWVKQMVKENKSMEIFDPVLMGKKSDESEMYQYLKIACQCLDDRSLRRPTMIQVMAMFKELQSDPDSDFLDGFSVGRIIIEESREKTP